MKKITLLLLSILIFLSNTVLAQTDTKYINKNRNKPNAKTKQDTNTQKIRHVTKKNYDDL